MQTKGQDSESIANSYRELVANLTKENQEMKMRIEDGNSDHNQLRHDLNSIEENYQKTILKI